MIKGHRLYLIILLLCVWIIDFIDQRYFYYFFERKPYQFMGMTLHFTVAWRYFIASTKWIITVMLFPHFFSKHIKWVVIAFTSLLFLDITTVIIMKTNNLNLEPLHGFWFQLLRLKLMNNYFMVFIGALTLLDYLKNKTEIYEYAENTKAK